MTVCVCVCRCVFVNKRGKKLSGCLANNKEEHDDHVVHNGHLALKQWPANESRFVYHPLIKLEYNVLWSHTVARLYRLD